MLNGSAFHKVGPLYEKQRKNASDCHLSANTDTGMYSSISPAENLSQFYSKFKQ